MTARRQRSRWLAGLVIPWVLALATGCEGDPEAVPCNESPECPVVDEDATEEDVRVLWTEGQMVELALDGQLSEVEVTGGEVVYTPDPDDPECEGACNITLKRLKIALKTLYFVSSEDSVKVQGLTLSLAAPLALENPDGSGSVVPAESGTLTCATVQGLNWAYNGALEEEAHLVARATSESLTLDIVAPMAVDASTAYGCRPFGLELRGTLTGATPFDQNPTLTASP
jgi:hypothetical protein